MINHHDEKIFFTPWCVGVWHSIRKWPFVVVGSETPTDGANNRPHPVPPLLPLSLMVVRSYCCCWLSVLLTLLARPMTKVVCEHTGLG
jgi:hypothetical protein